MDPRRPARAELSGIGVGFLDRLLGGGWDGTRGRPRSANGASSLHLIWDVPAGEWVGAEATLEVIDRPSTRDLHFWALQVSFADRGRRFGGAHLGLQWYDAHPGSTAVNWGGYHEGGGELDGSRSPLPSATGNVNTRDYAWMPGVPYTLRVTRSPDAAPDGGAAWRGSVTDANGTTTVVRDLWVDGAVIDGPMVWSEVFAPCDAPASAVRWSRLRLINADGSSREIRSVRVNYQRVSDGGCATTDSSVDADGFVQRTGTTRRTRQGAQLSI